MKAVVWSKPACPFCTKAKNLLKNKGIEYEEKNIAEGHKIQDLLDLGGYDQLEKKLSNLKFS